MSGQLTQRTSPRRLRRASTLVALGALSALLLAGCSSGGTTTASTGGSASGGAPAQDSAGAKSAPQARQATPGVSSVAGGPATARESASGAPVVGVGPKLTRSASLELTVTNIDAAAARVRAIATGLQAQVLSEQIGNGGPNDPMPLQGKADASSGTAATGGAAGTGSAVGTGGTAGGAADQGFGTLTLSVPADKLDTALDQLTKIGTVVRRTASAQDVTAQYVDTESRLKTMRASVARVRALMSRANDIGQVVALEGELSRREADLESLESQLSALKTSVAMSPLTVVLNTPGTAPLTDAGFVAGLRSGWDAFTASTRGLLTAIGAVLPFAALGALIAWGIVWWIRRRRTSPATGGSAS